MKPRLVIVDDNEEFRKEIRDIVELTCEVVGEAGDGIEALEACRLVTPDLVLMDIAMPRLSGIEATRQLQEMDNPPVVIMVSTLSEESIVLRAMEAGARDFLTKPVDEDRLLEVLGSYATKKAA